VTEWLKTQIRNLPDLVRNQYKQVADSPLVYVLSKNYVSFINSNFFKFTSFYVLKFLQSGTLKIILWLVLYAKYWINLWTFHHWAGYLDWVFLAFYMFMTPLWYGIIVAEIYGASDEVTGPSPKLKNSTSWLEIWNYETTHSMLLNNKTDSYNLYTKYRLTSFFNWHVIDNRVLTFFIFFLLILI
jgi:hypothetical protein